jgi:HEAT repeat protein
MKILPLFLFTAVGAGAFAVPAPARTPDPTIPAESWAPRDTADTLWRRGRIAISDEAWDEAARTFARLVERHPTSSYAGDALYWQAFALQRLGSSADLRRGVRALERQKEEYPQAATFRSGESSTLLTRLNGRLARSGDASAAAAISELASSAALMGIEAAASVMPMVAAELERARPEIERELAAASAEMRSDLAGMQRDLAQARAQGRVRARGSRAEIPAECEGVVGEEQVEALNALLQMSADQALPILKRVLERRDRCSEVLRRKAVFLVSQKRSGEAADILLSTARNDPDRETREQAVFWLSQTDSERALDLLEEILRDPSTDEEMQKKAIFSLSQSRSDRAQRALRDFIRRPGAGAEARSEAIFWIGQRGNAENAAFLREIFAQLDDRKLQERVIFSISQRRSSENSRWLLEQAKDARLDGDLRKSALFWAGENGAAVRDLAEIYDSAGDDRDVRNQVIFVLSQRRRDQAAMDKLFDIAQREPDPELRKQAIFWLGQANDARAAKLLEDIINKPMGAGR